MDYLIYTFQSSPYIKQNLAPTFYFYKSEVEITKLHDTINTVTTLTLKSYETEISLKYENLLL